MQTHAPFVQVPLQHCALTLHAPDMPIQQLPLVTLHVDNLRGQNAHHQAETVFKAFAKALRTAVAPDPRATGVPSTKGTL